MIGKLPSLSIFEFSFNPPKSLSKCREHNVIKNCKTYFETPKFCRDAFILTGYRETSVSMSDCIRSLFEASNETVNIWSHFLAAIYFLWILKEILHAEDVLEDSFSWPLIVYLITACLYPLTSSVAHVFSCMSPLAHNVCFFADYASISFYSYGSALVYKSYAFPCELQNHWYGRYYLPIALANTTICTFLACSSRLSRSDLLQKLFRLGAFLIPYLWDNIAIGMRLYNCAGDLEDESCRLSQEFHINQFIATFLAAFFYGSNLPERLSPGRFDFMGNSHNLLHLFGTIGTNEQIKAILLDKSLRRDTFIINGWETPVYFSLQLPVLILAVNCLIVFLFSTLTFTGPSIVRKEKPKVT